ncbi:MAG: RagB/SusD family nutrient uptake outer membrane protein [Bacteroides sp.]
MKLKYSLLSLVLLMGTSCNDSFLDRAPKDEQSDVSFWRDAEDAVKYTTGTYRYLIAPENHIIMTDCYTDNAVPVHVGAEQGQLSSGTATASNPHFKQVWQTAYDGIRRCDIYFANIGQVTMDDKKKEVLTGEITYLRAFFYATLVKYFGGVPILTQALELNEPIPARNTDEEVYNFIVKELDKAAGMLPLQRTELSEVGRATKGAALSLKAKMSNYFHKYDVAAKTAKEVMDLGIYGLNDNYENLFLPEYENNKEVIFDRQYVQNAYNSTIGSLIDQYFSPVMMGGWEAISPSQDLVDAYPCKDGKSIKESKLYNPEKPFENRDPRLAFSILWDGQKLAGKTYESKTMGDGNITRTGYCMRKYVNPKNDGNNDYGWTNFIYIRYADILLTYAEAQNELTGPDASVYAAINQVRQRPSVELPPLAAGLNKDQMRNAIRLERRLEFTFEGIHLFDTRSWRTTEADVKKPVYGKIVNGKHFLVEQRSFNPDRDYLWAIPLTEIDLSKGTLTQNPNY